MKPEELWDELMKEARQCQRTWGMGFPVISTELLRKYWLIATGFLPPPKPVKPSTYKGREKRQTSQWVKREPIGRLIIPSWMVCWGGAESGWPIRARNH